MNEYVKRFSILYLICLYLFVYSFALEDELLSCILDVVDVPESAKEGVIHENEFRKCLDWCDIWTFLLTTTGEFI
jgi:hypothetical protein